MIHSFNNQYYFARFKEGALDAIYRDRFKNLEMIERGIPQNRDRNGIDAIIHLESGEKIRAQEKWRKRKFTGDFLIEWCSIYRKETCQKPGWIYKIDADYLFTVYQESDLVKVYPVLQLKQAWNDHGWDWIRRFPIPPARNRDYVTQNIAVPCEILEAAILEQMTFTCQRKLPGVAPA